MKFLRPSPGKQNKTKKTNWTINAMTIEPAGEIIARLSLIPFRKITRSDGVLQRGNEVILIDYFGRYMSTSRPGLDCA